ncbi:uncharacterized protein LOC113311871 [Papaver somniferum]|uniref:uncharacterized protein LOC113311871 n=1 Tax=Papaver somniferum TaxID=3469 RepID=UPI000E6FE3C9|nr:uncharacterized protein LOC113311871 [Papaver somniferum]
MLEIISWNVNGLRDPKRRARVKRWCLVQKPDIIVFQETLLRKCSDSIVRQIWGPNLVEWIALALIGRSGGVLVLWNPNKIQMVDHIVGTFSVNICFKNCIDNFQRLFSGVYGPCSVVERRRVWKELQIMNVIWSLPWCICGDFNEVRFMAERKGCSRITRGMQDFGNFIDSNNLIDIQIQGAKYTWISSSSIHVKSKIDRFLISEGWDDHFPSIAVKAIARPMSDHKTIMLSCSINDWGPPPWSFEGMWLFDNSLLDLMSSWWGSFVVEGPPGNQLAKKFQLLKAKLRLWNREVFGNINRKFEWTLEQIKLLDQLLDEGTITNVQLVSRNHLKLQFENIADMQEMHLKTKSRVQWQLDGDRNTKFYHRIAKSRRRKNTYARFFIDGSWVEDKSIIKSRIMEHFHNKFKLYDKTNFSLDNLGLNSIFEDNNRLIERNIEEDEFLYALKSLGQDKAQARMVCKSMLLLNAGFS